MNGLYLFNHVFDWYVCESPIEDAVNVNSAQLFTVANILFNSTGTMANICLILSHIFTLQSAWEGYRLYNLSW